MTNKFLINLNISKKKVMRIYKEEDTARELCWNRSSCSRVSGKFGELEPKLYR